MGTYSKPRDKMQSFHLLILVLSAVSSVSQSAVPTMLTSLDYTIKVKAPPPGSRLRIWVPYPRENSFQFINEYKIDSNAKWKLNTDPKFGNKILYYENDREQGADLYATFTYTIRRTIAVTGVKYNKNLNPYDDPKLFNQAEKQVPFSPLFKDIALTETSTKDSEKVKVKKLFEYVVRSMTYNKTGTGWGNGDAVWACSTKRGNCTDFHSLLIGLSRALVIPARFIIGFSIPSDSERGDVLGYHCWAEAYSKNSGWIPMDATEAKKSGNSELYFGALPANRIEFSLGRDLELVPKQSADLLNYFIYPYAELNGKPYLEITQQFHFKKLKNEAAMGSIVH